jgi:hypothetical protein
LPPRFRLSAAEWITVASLLGAAIMFAVRLEGRVDAGDQAIRDIKTEHQRIDAHIYEELRYIRERVDELHKQPQPR